MEEELHPPMREDRESLLQREEGRGAVLHRFIGSIAAAEGCVSCRDTQNRLIQHQHHRSYVYMGQGQFEGHHALKDVSGLERYGQ